MLQFGGLGLFHIFVRPKPKGKRQFTGSTQKQAAIPLIKPKKTTMEVGSNGKENGAEKQEIFSKAVRAGKRTYFFDVKATKGNDYYLTITESKKRFGDDGKFYYEKHKIFLYKEDFDKFAEGLSEAVNQIRTRQPETVSTSSETTVSSESNGSFSDVNFDDLGSK
jgi:hypothetical protein